MTPMPEEVRRKFGFSLPKPMSVKKRISTPLNRKFSSLFALKENRPPSSEIPQIIKTEDQAEQAEMIPLYTIFVDKVMEQSLQEATELLKVSEAAI